MSSLVASRTRLDVVILTSRRVWAPSGCACFVNALCGSWRVAFVSVPFLSCLLDTRFFRVGHCHVDDVLSIGVVMSFTFLFEGLSKTLQLLRTAPPRRRRHVRQRGGAFRCWVRHGTLRGMVSESCASGPSASRRHIFAGGTVARTLRSSCRSSGAMSSPSSLYNILPRCEVFEVVRVV